MGFPGHFSCSLNAGGLKSLGLWSLDSEPKPGGISREQTVPISEQLLLSFSTPLPVLYNSFHLQNFSAQWSTWSSKPIEGFKVETLKWKGVYH